MHVSILEGTVDIIVSEAVLSTSNALNMPIYCAYNQQTLLLEISFFCELADLQIILQMFKTVRLLSSFFDVVRPCCTIIFSNATKNSGMSSHQLDHTIVECVGLCRSKSRIWRSGFGACHQGNPLSRSKNYDANPLFPFGTLWLIGPCRTKKAFPAHF